jgi:hypothetical protein
MVRPSPPRGAPEAQKEAKTTEGRALKECSMSFARALVVSARLSAVGSAPRAGADTGAHWRLDLATREGATIEGARSTAIVSSLGSGVAEKRVM